MLTMRKWISTVTIATLLSAATVASAAAVGNAPSKAVKAWDLDLAKAGDVATLYERVRTAATDVCRAEIKSYYRNTRTRAPSGWQERCVQNAVDSTVRRVANPALAALHTQVPRVAADVR